MGTWLVSISVPRCNYPGLITRRPTCLSSSLSLSDSVCGQVTLLIFTPRPSTSKLSSSSSEQFHSFLLYLSRRSLFALTLNN